MGRGQRQSHSRSGRKGDRDEQLVWAQGYRDGETIPIGLAEQIIGRIVATIDVPVTVDFESGYSETEGELSDNISRLLGLGVIGINISRTSSRRCSSRRTSALR